MWDIFCEVVNVMKQIIMNISTDCLIPGSCLDQDFYNMLGILIFGAKKEPRLNNSFNTINGKRP